MGLSFSERVDVCAACGGGLRPFDEPEVEGVRLAYAACTGCGLVQLDPRPTADELEGYYVDQYREGRGDADGSASAATQDRRAAQQVAFVGRTPARHLDVGCSTGGLLRAFGAREQVGVEPGARHREAAAASGIEVHASLEDLAATEPAGFDLVTMSHVLEHLPDPVASLRLVRGLLAPGGELFVEVPSLYRSLAYEPAHLLAFTSRSLASTLGSAGFAVDRRTVHAGSQGSLGRGRHLAVVAVPAEAGATGPKPVPVPLMRLGRTVGFAPQAWHRWSRRQARRIRRRLRR